MYFLAKLLGDFSAVEKGRISRRVKRRFAGRFAGRLLRRLIR